MEYATGQRQVVLNFSEKFCKTENEVLSSECFKEVWTKYIKRSFESENQLELRVLSLFPKKLVIPYTIKLFKLLLNFSVDEIKAMDPFFNLALDKKEIIYDLVQNFYDYWR